MKRTKPRQAASRSVVDKWQREVMACLFEVESLNGDARDEPRLLRLRRRLVRLDASMQRAQRRG